MSQRRGENNYSVVQYVVDMSADLKHKRQALNLMSMMLFCMIRVKLQTKRVRCYLIGINLGRIEIIV